MVLNMEETEYNSYTYIRDKLKEQRTTSKLDQWKLHAKRFRTYVAQKGLHRAIPIVPKLPKVIK